MKAPLLLASAAIAIGIAPAMAKGIGDWNIDPWTAAIGSMQLTAGGTAYGSAFGANQADAPGLDRAGVTGAATLATSLTRTYDSGLTLGLKADFEAYHDKLSGDNYGSDFVQKVYGVAQTGLGRVEVGMTDGAAYALAITGPVVSGEATLDNPNVTFFRNPVTGRAFTDGFALNSAVESSLNYAKVSYYTPRLFGIQLAASYTPSEGKDVVPFLNNGPHVANRQQNIWEGAMSYTGYFGPWSVGAYGGVSVAHNADRTADHKGLTDWGLGAEIDSNLSDDTKLALGVAFRKANSYAFDLNNVLLGGDTDSAHLSATVTKGPWIAGVELGSGNSSGSGEPALGIHGYEASLGYVVNANLQITGGWQELDYSRDSGVFYNGQDRIHMNAVFLETRLHV